MAGSAGVWWGTLTDISAGGCYIEMASPLPPGTVARLTLTLWNTVMTADAKVTVVHPMVGMGLSFTAWPGNEFQKLQGVLAAFSDETAIDPAAAAKPVTGISAAPGANLQTPAVSTVAQSGAAADPRIAAPSPAKTGANRSPTPLRISPQAAYNILDHVIKHLSQKGVLTTAEMLAILKQNSGR